MAFGEGSRGFNREVYHGGQFEKDMFGAIDLEDPSYIADLAKIANERGYAEFQAAVKLVKDHQPANPSSPKRDFFRDLLFAVQDHLGIDPESQPDVLKAFTAIGTPLDKFHSIDAFITYNHRGKDILVSLDATRNADKVMRGAKADIIVADTEALHDKDSDGYLDVIEGIGGNVAKIILKTQSDMAEGQDKSSVSRAA